MTPIELKKAAEVMRRASEGEIIERRDRELTPERWSVTAQPVMWNWQFNDYRILDFPDPPQGQKWHNPANLTATQVGIHEGWRLVLFDEVIEFLLGDLQTWSNDGWVKFGVHHPQNTYRTKSPLPEVKADPFDEAWPKIDEMCKRKDFSYCFATTIQMHLTRIGWDACKSHYKIP